MAILVKHPKTIKWTINCSLPTKSSTSLKDQINNALFLLTKNS